jgi:hypothetical protein
MAPEVDSSNYQLTTLRFPNFPEPLPMDQQQPIVEGSTPLIKKSDKKNNRYFVSQGGPHMLHGTGGVVPNLIIPTDRHWLKDDPVSKLDDPSSDYIPGSRRNSIETDHVEPYHPVKNKLDTLF